MNITRPFAPVDLVGLGALMKIKPNTTRAEFRNAYDMLGALETGRCNACWQGLPLVDFSPEPDPFVSLKPPNVAYKQC